jgi:hypothetical protein
MTTIEFAFKFKTLKYLFPERSFILDMELLLTSNVSKCKGGFFMSRMVVSSLLVAFIFIRKRNPDKYFNDLSLLKERSTSSRN